MSVAHGTLQGRVVPYVRVGKEKHTKRAKRYYADRDRVFAAVLDAVRRAGFDSFPLPAPYCVEAIAYFKPAGKRAKSPGGFSLTDGDADNIAKAIADHIEKTKRRPVGIIGNDALVESIRGTKRLTGPGEEERVEFALAWGESAKVLARTVWIIEEAA